jgi:hypothetical protein
VSFRYKLKARTPQKDDSGDILDALRQQLTRMRVRAVRRPVDAEGEPLQPQFPHDVSKLTDEALARRQSEFAAMAQYAQFQLALRAVEHSIARRADRITRAKVRLEKSGTNDDKAAKTEVDSRSRATSHLLLIAEGGERLTQAVLDGYIIGRDLCSREQTRRQSMNRL